MPLSATLSGLSLPRALAILAILAFLGCVPRLSTAQAIAVRRPDFAFAAPISPVDQAEMDRPAAPADSANRRTRNALLRTLTGGVGLGAGAALGVVVGVSVAPDNGDEYADLFGALFGGVGLGWVGATVGAALPRLGSPCGFAGRWGRAAVGSLVGGAVGALAYKRTPDQLGGALFVASFPIGAGIGTELMCRAP